MSEQSQDASFASWQGRSNRPNRRSVFVHRGPFGVTVFPAEEIDRVRPGAFGVRIIRRLGGGMYESHMLFPPDRWESVEDPLRWMGDEVEFLIEI